MNEINTTSLFPSQQIRARHVRARVAVKRRLLAELSALAVALGSEVVCAQETLPTIDIGPETKQRPVDGARNAPLTQPTAWSGRGESIGRGPTGVVGYVAHGTSTATKTNTAIMDIPQSITILTEEQLKDRNAVSLGQALTYAPGVSVAQGEGNRDQITIRGQNTTADFFTDGVRDDAEYYRDLYNIQAVEVLKGPSALIFGRGGGGGVVNRVTKKADGSTIREAVLSTGSWGRKRTTVDVGQAVSDTVAVRLNALYENSYWFRDFFKLERYGINPTLTWKPSEHTYVTLSYEHFRDHRTADRGIPSIGAVSLGGMPAIPGYPAPAPIDDFFGNPTVNYSKVDLNSARMIIDHTTDFGLNFHNQTVYADYEKRYQNTFANGPISGAGLVNISGYVNSTPRQNIFNQTDLTYKFEMTPEIRHTLLAGAEVGNQKSSTNRNNARFTNPFIGAGSINTPFWFPTIYTPVFFNNPNFRRHTDLDLAAAYVQDQIEITKYVDVIAGVRFDNFDLKFVDGLTFQELRRVDNLWSPRVGVVVKPFEQFSLYGSWSRSYLPAAGDQFNTLTVTTATLAPQGFQNFEVGFKAQILPILYFTGALYQLDRTNQQVTVGPFANILTNTRTNGGEVALVGYATDEWQVSLGYGHQGAYIVRADAPGAIGKIVPSVPKDTFSFWNKYDVSSFLGLAPGVLGVGGGVVYNSKFFAAVDNAVVIPGYARVDGGVFLNLGKNFFNWGEELSAQVNIENIFGAHYISAAHNNNNIMPGAPRSVFVTINAKL